MMPFYTVASWLQSRARHFNSFSFLSISERKQRKLFDSAQKLFEAKNGERVSLSLDPEGVSFPTIVVIDDRGVDLNLRRGTDIANYSRRNNSAIRANVPKQFRKPVKSFIKAVQAVNEDIVRTQNEEGITDSEKPGAPRIGSTDNLASVGINMSFRVSSGFHPDDLPYIKGSISSNPTLLVERQGYRVGTDLTGKKEDGRNIPTVGVHRARRGEVAIWDGQVTVHSAPHDTTRSKVAFFEWTNPALSR